MKRLIALSFVSLSLSFVFGCLVKSGQATLEDFYAYHAPDSEGLDPLILAGDKVVPLVIEKIQDRNMKKRGLAIDFLGNGKHKQAIPVLEKIVIDESEEEHVREIALVSIYQIDGELGNQFAQKFKSDGILAEISKDIIAKKSYLNYRRTYIDALFRRHD
jgi:hypothetical protein